MEGDKVPSLMECVLLLFVVACLGYHCVKSVNRIIRNEAERERKTANRPDDT
jgi:hypothetical protein